MTHGHVPSDSTPSPSPVCLGIEAGGTRTVAIAAGPGLPPTRREFGQANLWLLTDDQLARQLCAIARAMPRPMSMAIGMAGVRTGTDRARLQAAAARAWPGVPCHATSDLEVALMAAPEAVDPGGRAVDARVVIVSGTGSCCLGRAADGRTVRVGGWGHVLGDRGSGYDIVARALRAVVQAGDRGDWPVLGQRFLRALSLNEPHDLVGWIQAAPKAEVAALAVEVFDAAAARDRIATGVLAAAARTLADDACECARRVATPPAPVQFVLAGGVLLKQPRFAARVRRVIHQIRPGAVLTPLTREGAWGAVELARRHLGLPARAVEHGTAPAPVVEDSLHALAGSPTERRNPRSAHLDRLPVEDAVALMLREELRVPRALLAHRAAIARGVRVIARAFRQGGRLFYVGAGTSGRLGVLDASECPPTFRTSRDLIQGIIAGGPTALWSAVEGAEDDGPAGARALAARGIGRRDVVVGIAASGRTPFVRGALGEAKRHGAATILLCFNPHVAIPRRERPALIIAPDVGPEILTGSTRLKAGTATKLVLNAFTTLTMVRLGKVRGNLMIDMKPSNAKLRDRAVRIVSDLTGAGAEAARAALERTAWDVRQACARLARAGRREAGAR